MLFNSYIFLLGFGPITILLFKFIQKLGLYRVSLCFLILASLAFYGYQKPAYALLLIGSILVNYGIHLLFLRTDSAKKSKRRLILILGIIINLSVLFYFKYVNFFISNINAVFSVSFSLKNILLPLGISFYTFQQLSFVIDSYHGETNDYTFLEYALFVSFFPQLIAGPIVLHNELIPQFRENFTKSSASKEYSLQKLWEGAQYFIIGLSKKILIADFLGRGVDLGYSNINGLSSTYAVFLVIGYTLQIYFDFSGYCDMAIGLGKMIGFDITQNFNSPYRAFSITDFWKRWHITLTRFLTKYLYIPLGGNRKGFKRTLINIFLVFLISGFWHGAGWTFIFWGFLHGIMMVVERIITPERLKKIPRPIGFLYTFGFVNIAWVFFRATSFREAITVFQRILHGGFHLFDSKMISEMFSFISNPFITKYGVDVSLHPEIYTAIIFLIILAAVFLATKHPNTSELVNKKITRKMYPVLLAVLFVGCLINLSGVSTFLYFNF